MWLTLIIPQIVFSFITSPCNVNSCWVDPTRDREHSTTSVGVSQPTWPPDISLHAKGAHLLLHTLKGDVLTGCRTGWSQRNTIFSVVTNSVLIPALFEVLCLLCCNTRKSFLQATLSHLALPTVSLIYQFFIFFSWVCLDAKEISPFLIQHP